MVELRTRADLITDLEKIVSQQTLGEVETARVSRVQRVTRSDMSPVENAREAAAQIAIENNRNTGIFTAAKRRIFNEDISKPLVLADKIRPSTVATFGMLGAIGGMRGGPAGAVIGGVIGATGGAVIPEFTASVGEAIGIFPAGTRQKFARGNEELAIIARGEAGADSLIGAFAVLPRLVGRAVSSSATEINKAGRELAQFASVRLGVRLLPFMVTSGETLAKNVLNALGRLPLVGAPARKQVFLHQLRMISNQINVRGEANAAVTTLSKKIGDVTEFPDLANAIFGDSKNLFKFVKNRFKTAYAEVYKLGDEAGAKIDVVELRKATDEVLSDILERSSINKKGKRTIDVGDQKLVDFIKSPAILQMNDIQTLRSYDGALDALDDFVRLLSKDGIPTKVLRDLNRLRNAMIIDISQNGIGPVSKQIGKQLRQIDQAHGRILSGIFETSVALKFGRVTRGGLKSGRYIPTSTAVEGLTDLVLDLNKPLALDELFKLMTLDTTKRVAATVVERALNDAMRATGRSGIFRFNATAARRVLGIGDTTTGRQSTMKNLLKRAGSPFTLDDLDKAITVFDRVQEFDVTSAATFLSRKMVIGGGASALVGVFAIAQFTSSPILNGTIGLIVLAGGVRAFVRSISNPAGARAFRTVLREEAGLTVRRGAAMRLLKFALNPAPSELEVAAETGAELAVEPSALNRVMQDGREIIQQLYDAERADQKVR